MTCRRIAGLPVFTFESHAQFSYTNNSDNTLTLVYYSGSSGQVEIPAGSNNLGVSMRRFGFKIMRTASIPIVIAATSNLAAPLWTPVLAVTLTNGLFYFAESMPAGAPGRYCRISAPGRDQ
jgi:hypothetical protein